MPDINSPQGVPGARLRPELEAASGLYITGEDNLRIQTFNAASGVRVLVAGRFLTEQGEIVPFQFEQAPNTDRTVRSTIARLGPGWIQNVFAVASAGAPLIGQTFVLVQIVRGDSGAVTELATILQGMVTSTQRLAWPGSAVVSTIGSPGNVRLVTGTNPAAGVEITETVPTGARWKLRSFRARLVTSATVAGRRPLLIIDDGASSIVQFDPPESQAASEDFGWVTGPGMQRLGSTFDTKQWGMPVEIMLLAGWRIRTSTGDMQAADNWSAPQLSIEEWIEGA
jgi:hypothetical protein